MSSPDELDFARMIVDCRASFDRGRSGLLRWLGVNRRQRSNGDAHTDSLRQHYDLLADRGQVVWGAIAQVNMNMFSPGANDHPGVTIYSTDRYYDAHPHDLSAIGRACFQFKNTIPTDPEFRAVADRLTDEYDQTIRAALPERLCDGRRVYMGATMFHRTRLPGGHLQAGAFPLVVAPDHTELNMVLPLGFWSKGLRAGWDRLQDRLQRTPVDTTAGEVALLAEKRPIEHRGPDWDVEAMPVKVTPAMAAYCRERAQELQADSPFYLTIGFRDNARKAADVCLDFDPQTQVLFTSNGVQVVVRKDQLERVRGSVVDYVSNAFATGVLIRSPGE